MRGKVQIHTYNISNTKGIMCITNLTYQSRIRKILQTQTEDYLNS